MVHPAATFLRRGIPIGALVAAMLVPRAAHAQEVQHVLGSGSWIVVLLVVLVAAASILVFALGKRGKGE